jgi:hypothetical protein
VSEHRSRAKSLSDLLRDGTYRPDRHSGLLASEGRPEWMTAGAWAEVVARTFGVGVEATPEDLAADCPLGRELCADHAWTRAAAPHAYCRFVLGMCGDDLEAVRGYARRGLWPWGEA